MTGIAKLDVSSLGQAIIQLEQSLEYYHSDVVQRDPGLILQLRSAAIQAFEFTYELSWKMLKRYLEMAEPTPGMTDEMSFPDLIRTACEQGLLLSDLTTWLVYRKARGTTSHAYDQKMAQQVFEQVPAFLKEATYLYVKLQERIKSL